MPANFPSVLKIDRASEGQPAETAELIGSIIALARSLNLRLTAGGLETPAQLG